MKARLLLVILLVPIFSSAYAPAGVFYQQNNIPFRSPAGGCGLLLVDDTEDSYSLDSSCSREGSQGNFFDEQISTGIVYDCPIGKGLTADASYDIDPSKKDYTWSIYWGIHGGSIDILCYDYAQRKYERFKTFEGGSLGAYDFGIPDSCYTNSPLRLRLRNNDADDIVLREEWIKFFDPDAPSCGDGCCLSSETEQSCSQDCYADYKVVLLSTLKNYTHENERFVFNATVKNFGTANSTRLIEGAIVPQTLWQYYGLTIDDYYRTLSSALPSCCPENPLAQAYALNIAPGAIETITFNVSAPNISSKHPCGSKESTWGEKYMLFAGVYPSCGSAYSDKRYFPFWVWQCNETDYCDSCLNKADNNGCDCNIECMSEVCGGAREVNTNICSSDRSSGYTSYYNEYSDSCGGSGILDQQYDIYTSCNGAEVGFGNVCDSEHDQGESNPCRRDMGESCNHNSDCWNEDGGNFCSSLDACSDGENGRECRLNSDCLSSRCDNICVSRLSNWEACDENSDCGSNICTNQTCRPTAPVCGDGYCEDERAESWQSCASDCKIDDCDSNIDCPAGHYCDFRAGDDPCIEVEYADECSLHDQWFCQGGDVYYCENAGRYYKAVLKRPCRLDKVCDSSTVQSSHDCGSSSIELQIEDATPGAAVYKQGGDKAAVYIYSKSAQAVDFDYPAQLMLDEGICRRGNVYLSGNLTKCVFSISENATGSLWIRAGNKEQWIEVIDNPELLIVTDREKLFLRFNDANGVRALLAKTYETASFKRGIVYDLGMELSGHPFLDFDSYSEDILSPRMTDNTYSLSVADFINNRCNGCENTIILGDDYVVPGYRRDITDIESSWHYLWLDEHPQSYNIYTDSPYISRTQAPFSQFDSLFTDEYGYEKKVMFIEQDSMGQEMRDALFGLKETLRSKYKISVETINSSSIGCNSFFKLGKKTLFIVGDINRNTAFSCYPYFEADEEADGIIQLEKNVWSNRIDDYSVLVNTDEADVITAFRIFVEKENYKVLQKNALYFAKRGTDVCSIGGMYPGIDIIGDCCDAVSDCVFERKWGWCGFDVAMVVIPIGSARWGKITKQLIDLGEEGLQFYNRWGDRAVDMMHKLSKYDDATKKKVFEGLNLFDNAPKTNNLKEGGRWTTKQADKAGQVVAKIKKGDNVKVYHYAERSHFLDIVTQNRIDTEDLRKTLKNPNGAFSNLNNYRFGPKIYTSTDEVTALSEVSKVKLKSPTEFEERVLFESDIYKANLGDIDIVPSVQNLYGGVNLNGKNFEDSSIFHLNNGVGTADLSDSEIKKQLEGKEFKVVRINTYTGEVTNVKMVSGSLLYEGGKIEW